MFDLWRLRWQKRKIERAFWREERDVCKDRNSTQADIAEVRSREHFETQIYEEWIDVILSDRLTDKAKQMDIELPFYSDEKYWQHDEHHDRMYLTQFGRSQVRKLIDEEKTRRFEVATRWVKLIALLAPVLGAAAGFIGALIGWVAIHKK